MITLVFSNHTPLVCNGIKGLVELFWNANFAVWHTEQKNNNKPCPSFIHDYKHETICIHRDATAT